MIARGETANQIFEQLSDPAREAYEKMLRVLRHDPPKPR